VLRAYMSFYNPINTFRTLLSIRNDSVSPKRLDVSMSSGRSGCLLTIPRMLAWAWRLKRGPIEPYSGLTATRIPMIDANSGQEINWAIEHVPMQNVPSDQATTGEQHSTVHAGVLSAHGQNTVDVGNPDVQPLGRSLMDNPEPTAYDRAESEEIAIQIQIELRLLLSIERSLRTTLQWMTRERGNTRKLSTLRSIARSFERQLSRTRVLADQPGYLHLITAATPDLTSEVQELRKARETLQAGFEGIVLRLEYVSPDDADALQSKSVSSLNATLTA
jgi:hypothetical protein